MAKKYDKEQIISDWRTGGYTIRDLAYRHGVSHTTIGKIVKGVEKDLVDKVDKTIQVKQELNTLNDKEHIAVSTVVKREIEKRLIAQKIDDDIDDGVSIAVRRAIDLLQSEHVEMEDIERFSKAQNNFRVGLKTQDKFSNQAQVNINNTNAQQNAGPVVLKLGDGADIDAKKLGW